MSVPLMRFLLARYWLASVLCALPPVLIGVLIGWLYPRYAARTDALRGMLPFAEKLMGDDLIDIWSLVGFFQVPFQHPLTLVCVSVAVALPALLLPANERGTGGLDLLLATPLTRRQLVGTVALLQLPIAFLLALGPLAGTWLGSGVSHVQDDLDFALFAQISLGTFLLGTALGAIALLVSVLSPDRSRATVVYGSIVFGGVLGVVVASFWQAGAWVERLTPFGYYHPPRVLHGGALPAADWIPLVLGTLALVGCALEAAHRRRSA